MNKQQFLSLWSQFRANGTYPHGLLITGPSHLISDISSLLLPMMCYHPKEAVACGSCRACVQHRTEHTSDHWILSVAEGQTKVPLEAIRRMQKAVLLKKDGSESLPFFVVVPNVSQISMAGWNVLLKTLEEPPEKVSFILFGTLSHALPVTIRSRVSKVFIYEEDSELQHVDKRPFELSLQAYRQFLEKQRPSTLEDWRAYAASCYRAMKNATDTPQQLSRLAGAFIEFSDVLSRKGLDGSVNVKYAFSEIVSRYE